MKIESIFWFLLVGGYLLGCATHKLEEQLLIPVKWDSGFTLSSLMEDNISLENIKEIETTS